MVSLPWLKASRGFPNFIYPQNLTQNPELAHGMYVLVGVGFLTCHGTALELGETHVLVRVLSRRVSSLSCVAISSRIRIMPIGANLGLPRTIL